jgi:hypothetical protein
MGMSVTWDASNNRLIASKAGKSLRFVPGSSNVIVDGSVTKKMAVAATNVNGTLMIHGQFLTKELGWKFVVQ